MHEYPTIEINLDLSAVLAPADCFPLPARSASLHIYKLIKDSLSAIFVDQDIDAVLINERLSVIRPCTIPPGAHPE